ncbi:hypothetical protein BDFB_005721 [Asbolus verrucosus]|uniref:Uncharacterized protein n=1 Tax=Asbolus verrucosus TaxID=1661398 RepID=A0A482VRQ8_ASBVE|nr:hypothetical protein BDFB_005721 [Asbolus verrucosus]
MAIIFGLLKTTGSRETTAAHDHIVHMPVAAFHDLHTLPNRTFIGVVGKKEKDALSFVRNKYEDVGRGNLIISLRRKTYPPSLHGIYRGHRSSAAFQMRVFSRNLMGSSQAACTSICKFLKRQFAGASTSLGNFNRKKCTI